MPKHLEAQCPTCKEAGNIAGAEIVFGWADIQGFEPERDEDGALVAIYAGDTDVIWDSQRAEDKQHPWGCRKCGESFSDAELILTEVEN